MNGFLPAITVFIGYVLGRKLLKLELIGTTLILIGSLIILFDHPYEILKKINETKSVLPSPEINKLIQNRMTEKEFLNKNNITTTQFVSINDLDDIKINDRLIPGLLKTCTLGYDGKGQYKIINANDLNEDFDFSKGYILEKIVNLKKEISVVVTRFGHQKYEIYDPIENYHEDQILKHSKIPADISDEIKNKALDWAKTVAEELDYIGTMCVEFFIDKNNNLYANEVAPRVHNSGHLTINSHNISQFENHIRAVCGLEKLETKKIYNAKMLNLIGEDILEYKNKKFKENEFFYDYLKKEVKAKRKNIQNKYFNSNKVDSSINLKKNYSIV